MWSHDPSICWLAIGCHVLSVLDDGSGLTTCIDFDESRPQIILQITSNMSSYYSSVISAPLPNSANQDTYITQDNKFDPSFYTAGQSLCYDTEQTHSPGTFPRFPPYDRIDARSAGTNITSKCVQYTPASPNVYQNSSLNCYSTLPQNGQYTHTPDTSSAALETCKLGDTSVLVNTPATAGVQPSPMMGHQYTSSASMPVTAANGGQSGQSMSVYPWMRAAAAGTYKQGWCSVFLFY